MTTKDYIRLGQFTYALFVALSLYAINQASNDMLMYAFKYLLSWLAWAIQAFVF